MKNNFRSILPIDFADCQNNAQRADGNASAFLPLSGFADRQRRSTHKRADGNTSAFTINRYQDQIELSI